MDINFKITGSELIEYDALNHAKIFPVLLFLSVVISTLGNKLMAKKMKNIPQAKLEKYISVIRQYMEKIT